MGAHYQDTAIGPRSVTVGLWDAGVEAPEHVVSKQAWGASFIFFHIYCMVEKNPTNENNPFVFYSSGVWHNPAALSGVPERVVCALYLGTVQV